MEIPSELYQCIILRNEGYSMQVFAKKISNQDRKRSGRPQYTTVQEDKRIRVPSLKKRYLTDPQLATVLKSSPKKKTSNLQ